MQHVLQESSKEGMGVIWEVVGDVQLVHQMGNENFKGRDGEKAWRRLAQVMDMTEVELNRAIEGTRLTVKWSNYFFGEIKVLIQIIWNLLL